MTRHAAAELLSAYLDEELPGKQNQALAAHLAECSACRARLASLSRVAAGLARLERFAPPPTLARELEHRIVLEGRPSGLVERLERGITSLPVPSSFLVNVALVCALGAIVYLFAFGLERHDRRASTLFLAPAVAADACCPREAGGRLFDEVDGAWRERGLPAGETPRRLDPGSPEGAALLARHPELRDLLRADAAVVFQAEDGVIELRPAAPGD